MKSLMPQIDSNDGLFHNGNPATGEQGTRVTDTWLNNLQDRVRDVQEEAHYVLQKAGFRPVENKQTQLYEAIVKIIDDNRKTASLTQKGEVRLTSDTGLDSEELGLTAKAGKKLAQLIATVQLALNNYIPLNKRSSAVNSNDENNVATSKAVKTAYDKGVEAKTAADNAQRSANAANNNANGRVSKNGDAINGILFIDGVKSGGFANGLVIRNKAGGQNTSGFVDFYQSDTVPRSSIWFRDAGKNSTQIEFLNTPEEADWNIDSRQLAFKVASTGALWGKQYGWLHDFFAKQSDINNVWEDLNNTFRKNRFRHQHYPHHYNGAEVFDIPIADNGVMRVIVMSVSINGYARVNLPEALNGSCVVQVTDVGGGRKTVGANIQNGNVVEIHNGGEATFNILAIGWYGW